MPKRNPTNPFKPTAGAEPPVLIGRKQVIDDFIDGLDEGVGAPGRLMRISGPRGSGKTVLMAELGAIAQKRDWVVIRESARKDLVNHLVSKLATKLTERPMRYLCTMAKGSGPTATSDIAAQLGVPPASLSSARAALIAKQIIEPVGRGYVDFSIPHMREYIEENAEDLLAKFE